MSSFDIACLDFYKLMFGSDRLIETEEISL